MLLREFLGMREPRHRRAAARIRTQQREDGTWANFHGGAGDLSTTIEAYWALRLAGDEPDEQHMRAAAAFVRAGAASSGRACSRTSGWRCSGCGLGAGAGVPPEIVLLPPWMPLNVYDFACWARQTIVALSLVIAHRPAARAAVRPARAARPRAVAGARASARRGRLLVLLDRAAHVYERRPIGPLRRRALARAERWIVRRQEADGSWGGIQPPSVYSLMALHLCGYPSTIR